MHHSDEKAPGTLLRPGDPITLDPTLAMGECRSMGFGTVIALVPCTEPRELVLVLWSDLPQRRFSDHSFKRLGTWHPSWLRGIP